MSELVGVFGVQHNPLLWRALNNPEDPQLIALRVAFAEMSERLRALRPDVIVVVATDHLSQWFYDNMPTFLVGKAEVIQATFASEEREFGITKAVLHGDVGLGAWLHEDAMGHGVDFAGSDAFRVDHSVLVPLHFLTPDLDVPIVPVFTNAIAPPFPSAERFLSLGQVLRRSIEASPLDRRVVVVASGHLATEVGGPRQFRGSPDHGFDGDAVGAVRDGRIAELLRLSAHDRLLAAGNVTHQFLNFVTAVGVAGGGPASYADAFASRFATSPFFEWTGEALRP
jgi:catalytic LigB subunit of aromatic ring-opening dioxygenase